MYRHRALSRGRPYFYYRCFGRGSDRRSCGNAVRVELVDAAVNEVMTSTFDVPVMRDEIAYGNEAEIEAELERIKLELSQLGKLGLPTGKRTRSGHGCGLSGIALLAPKSWWTA
jgi:hypothetical protein